MEVEKIETFEYASYKLGFLDGYQYMEEMSDYYIDEDAIAYDMEFYIDSYLGKIDVQWYCLGFRVVCRRYLSISRKLKKIDNKIMNIINDYYYSNVLDFNQAVIKYNTKNNQEDILSNTLAVNVLKLTKNKNCNEK